VNVEFSILSLEGLKVIVHMSGRQSDPYCNPHAASSLVVIECEDRDVPELSV
jgi:hypothetical protein